MSSNLNLNWWAIVITCILTFVGGLLIPTIALLLGLCVPVIVGENQWDILSKTLTSHYAKAAISLIPVLIGALCLTKYVSRNTRLHTLAFSVLFLSLTASIILVSFDGKIDWQIISYCIAIIPVAFLGEMIGKHHKVKKLR